MKFVVGLLLVTGSVPVFAADWPQFRGPTGLGLTDEKELPLKWGGPEKTNVLWQVPLQGQGHASPIVSGDAVFVCTVEWPTNSGPREKSMPAHHVARYRTTDGRLMWDTIVPPGPWLRTDFRSGPGGGYAAPTPATDGKRVFCLFGSSVLAALDFEGKIVWRKEIIPHTFDVTIGSSPVLFRDTLFIFCAMAKASDSCLLAFDPANGEEKWRAKFPDMGFGHSTPVLIEVNGQPQLLVLASGMGVKSNALRSLDPATGQTLWWCRGAGDASSPAYGAGLVYFDSGRGGAGVAVDPTGRGDVTETHIRWTVPQVPEAIGSPNIIGQHVYRLHSPGVLKCWEVATGKLVYGERLEGLSTTWASPIADGAGHLFFANAGKSYVLQTGPEFRVLAVNDLGDGNHASPAVSAGRFFLVGAKSLHCIGNKFEGNAKVPRVLFMDDFETASTQSPPPGWAMWGAAQHKVPANYTRDTTNPHSGRTCFRIHHPAKTDGYVVLAPDRAIRPKSGMIYTVSFWARADRAGKALFSWTAYQSVNPFVDAGSPGSLTLDAGRDWKEFTFSVREGLDLFADQSRFLLLTYKAATDSNTERTLWIDDVRVVEQPDPTPARLLNEATLPHDALPHRLRPGATLDFIVDASQRVRRATRDVGGVSFHRVCGWTGQPYSKKGEYTLAPELETAIREMRLPMTRIYAVGDEPFSIESAIDKVADLCRRVGVTEDHCVLEFENQGASTKLPPETWARGVRHSLQRGYGFHHWEIANEPYASLWGHGEAFPTPESFATHFKSVSRAIRGADPKAQIGVDIDSQNVRWGNYLLKELAGDYDFVAPHYYCGASVHKLPFEEIALTENYRMLDRVLRINALLRAYNPQREVFQYDTEWGMICSTPEGKEADYEDRNANIIGTIHRAVRLIYYAREDLLRGASGWQMFSRLGGQGFGILSQEAPDKRFMLYWLYYYFNRHLGEWVLPTDGTAPYHQPQQPADRGPFTGPLTPALVTQSDDGQTIYLVIANGSWSRAVPCQVHLRNFRARQATGLVLTNDRLDAKPLLERKEDAVSDFAVQLAAEDATCLIPPHSVVFVTLTR